MEHGKGSDERQQKARPSRHNNTPPVEKEPLEGPGRGQGSTTGPSREAIADNAARHRREEAEGEHVAGVDGRRRLERDDDRHCK